MTDLHVRVATQIDEAELMELCRLLHSENGKLFEMDEDRVREILRRGFNKQGGIIGAIGEAGKIEAMIAMILSQMWYSTEWVIEELFSYCHPDHRRTNNAKHLIAFAKKCSDEIGIPLLIGIISNERTASKIRLYRRQLAEPSGAFFIYSNKLQKVA